MTLDLQLYAKCIKLRSKNEIKGNFIFILGELHVVFAFLKVYGKHINCSGLDQILVNTKILLSYYIITNLEWKTYEVGFRSPYGTIFISI